VRVRVPRIDAVLHESQRKVYENLARFSVLEIGRRWGKTTFGHVLAQYKAMDGKRVARSGAGGLLVEGRGVGGTVVSVLLLGASGPLLVRALIRPPFSVPCVCV
jgi:hypothetical protein